MSRPNVTIPGGGFWTTRACGDCGRYISQRGSTVRVVRNIGRQWVGRCCANAAAQTPERASLGSPNPGLRTSDAAALIPDGASDAAYPGALADLGREFAIDFSGKEPTC